MDAGGSRVSGIVVAMRSSVSMGDDCHAPHRTEPARQDGMRLSELMREIMDYLPSMTDVSWKVVVRGGGTLARIVSDADGRRRCELAVPDGPMSRLNLREVFCRHEGAAGGEGGR